MDIKLFPNTKYSTVSCDISSNISSNIYCDISSNVDLDNLKLDNYYVSNWDICLGIQVCCCFIFVIGFTIFMIICSDICHF